MKPYSRPKLSDVYTLSRSKLLENHTLHSGTYLYTQLPIKKKNELATFFIFIQLVW